MNIDTFLKQAWLIDFIDQDGTKLKGQIVWGIISEDRKNRWVEDDFCCTSLVINLKDDGLVQTKNSVYKVNQVLNRITLPIKAFPFLRAGHSPKEAEFLLSIDSPLDSCLSTNVYRT